MQQFRKKVLVGKNYILHETSENNTCKLQQYFYFCVSGIIHLPSVCRHISNLSKHWHFDYIRDLTQTHENTITTKRCLQTTSVSVNIPSHHNHIFYKWEVSTKKSRVQNQSPPTVEICSKDDGSKTNPLQGWRNDFLILYKILQIFTTSSHSLPGQTCTTFTVMACDFLNIN